MLAIALLGRGKASLRFGMSLGLSTLWRHGWWLYIQPECAPVLFLLSGTTADVALGFLLTSLLQVRDKERIFARKGLRLLLAIPTRSSVVGQVGTMLCPPEDAWSNR